MRKEKAAKRELDAIRTVAIEIMRREHCVPPKAVAAAIFLKFSTDSPKREFTRRIKAAFAMGEEESQVDGR